MPGACSCYFKIEHDPLHTHVCFYPFALICNFFPLSSRSSNYFLLVSAWNYFLLSSSDLNVWKKRDGASAITVKPTSCSFRDGGIDDNCGAGPCEVGPFCAARIRVRHPKPPLASLRVARRPMGFGVLMMAVNIRISTLLLNDGRDLVVLLPLSRRYKFCPPLLSLRPYCR